MATRSEPALPLARWRARGQLAELDAARLRFSAAETEAFLNEFLKLGLDRADVRTLRERTEGWPAGLYLAALSIRDRAGGIRVSLHAYNSSDDIRALAHALASVSPR